MDSTFITLLRDQISEMGLTKEHVEAVRPSWVKMTLPEQLGNIGSEVSRVIKGRDSHTRYWKAVTRALDLYYALLAYSEKNDKT